MAGEPEVPEELEWLAAGEDNNECSSVKTNVGRHHGPGGPPKGIMVALWYKNVHPLQQNR